MTTVETSQEWSWKRVAIGEGFVSLQPLLLNSGLLLFVQEFMFDVE